MNWELRQFEIGEDHLLENALVTNTPMSVNHNNPIVGENGLLPLNIDYNFSKPENLDVIKTPSSFVSNPALINWIYGPNGNSINRIRVKFENHIIPQSMLDVSAIVDKEINHYFGLDWSHLPSNVYDPGTYSLSADEQDLLAKTIRHKISLNTCQGCHAGENKTQLTQMRPQGFGRPAVYWNNGQPDGVARAFDDRFETQNQFSTSDEKNSGSTYDDHFQTNVENSKFIDDNNDEFKQAVSPFLTGRRYRVSNSINTPNNNPWDDDEFDPNIEGIVNGANILSDEKLTGFFIVNDPSNEAQTIPANVPNLNPGQGGAFPQLHDQKWRFNDLQRRKDFLCRLINRSCDGSVSASDILHDIIHIPFAVGAH